MNATHNRRAQVQNEPLIPFIEVSGREDLLVDARMLHNKLKVEHRFNDWINNRIHEFDFVENQDFIVTNNLVKIKKFIGTGHVKRIDYHLTLDMAKELAMLERSAVGRSIRKYFINAEKEYRSKRLYGQVATMSEIKKKVPTMSFNGRLLFQYRPLQKALGYSTKSSLSNVRRCYDSQLCIVNRVAYVTEDYGKLMIARATAKHTGEEVKEAPALLPPDFGQLKLSVQ